MSKYGNLSRTAGNSSWFLKKTLEEHDRSMEHPWMKMIYNQSFSAKQYGAWLALNHAVFAKFETYTSHEVLAAVHDVLLLRTAALEADLPFYLGSEWRAEAARLAQESPATQRYLTQLEADASTPIALLAHHFLQYNAVLSGGAYLGEMVSQKMCLPYGAPGVEFYAFQGVEKGKGPARVQKYLRAFDKTELSDEERELLLAGMKRIYADTEAMMAEIFEMNPGEGIDYTAAKEGNGSAPTPPTPIPEAEQLELNLVELHGYTGADGGRILISLAGELLDVSTGREMYGPEGGYSMLAGREVSKCLGTMSLETTDLDDLRWEPDNSEEEQALNQWLEKLKAKYPVAGRLKKEPQVPKRTEGVRRRAAAAPAPAPKVAPAAAPPAKAAAVNSGSAQKCPISGKEGAGCPMSFMGIGPPKGSAEAKSAPAPTGASSGFMAGKSLIASVEKSQPKSGWEDSFLFKICPLHWDANTIKLLAIVSVTSWLSGVFVGWNLYKQVML